MVLVGESLAVVVGGETDKSMEIVGGHWCGFGDLQCSDRNREGPKANCDGYSFVALLNEGSFEEPPKNILVGPFPHILCVKAGEP